MTINTHYSLTVVNGMGSGSYEAGTMVNIASDANLAGYVFSRWVSDSGGAFANAATIFTIPAGDVTVEASDQATSGIPKTGDDSDMLGLMTALLSSVFVMLRILVWGKGQKPEGKGTW